MRLMMALRSPAVRLLATLTAVAALIATVNAAWTRSWDTLAALAVLDVLLLALLAGSFGPRRPVTVRADLARWLEARAAETGEPVERIADRAIAAHRQRLDRPSAAS